MFPRSAGSRVARARVDFRVFSFAALLLAPLVSTRTRAGDLIEPEASIVRPVLTAHATGAPFGATNSSCAGSTCDTVWVGHKPGTFLGVAVGGVWNFDDDAAGTDSSQGCRHWVQTYASGASLAATDRPSWAYDYGNMINEGNTNLMNARLVAGRKFVSLGIVGAWHSDPMTSIRRNANPATNGGELSAQPIHGSRSAWCGLRVSGDQTAQDALTGNYINGDLYSREGNTSTTNPEFPGYVSLWDQMMYKDFPSGGAGTVTARVRCDVSDFIDNATADGSGWFNPDPTNIANFVKNPADSFMVYVGSPNEAAFDTNRRWFSEVLDFTQPVKELFAYGEKLPVNEDGQSGQDTLLTLPYSGVNPVSGNVRLVFRVKTNRARADGVVSSTAGVGNTKDGAAVIDDVTAGTDPTVYGFETAGSVTARSLIPDLAAAGGAWATTGRPAAAFFHIENLANLLYEDLCGSVDSPVRRCNLRGNVAVAGDFDHGDIIPGAGIGGIETRGSWETPTVNLAVRTAAPGTKNDQGIDQATASRSTLVLDYDIYSGFMGLDQSDFWQFGGRFYGPSSHEPVSTNVQCWSPWLIYPGIVFQPDPFCVRGSNGNNADNISSLGVPGGQIDSLRAMVEIISQGWRFGGTDLGNTRGTYFDNLRIGFVRKAAPDLAQDLWNKYQDQFPVNENVTPADNAGFDTTTAYVRTALNIVSPINGKGYVAGDSLTAYSPFSGDGVTTGVRMDLVFRIDPGPGNYTAKGDRASALIEKDPAHPFWATYEANAGDWGSGGTGDVSTGGNGGVPQGSIDGGIHPAGTLWNKDWWNSCRMDSAEINLWPVVGRGINVPLSPVWMGTIHESDPKFATLGINHLVCFLSNPAGNPDVTNTDCGTPGASPPASGYNATTNTNWGAAFLNAVAVRKEGTKIIPDGYLSPGAHVEYFLRRSLLDLQSPSSYQLLFDTTTVFPQDPSGNANFDQERWSSFNVLPDLWKSGRFDGAGLACMLMVDGADRRGADPAYRGAADTLGFGKLNGAAQGWTIVNSAATNSTQSTGRGPNNPAGFVASNFGQYGINYDHYDIRAAESGECGHLGARLASIQSPGNSDPRRTDKSGPSPAMLANFYSTVLHLSGDLRDGTLDDKVSSQEQADDLTFYDAYLQGASSGNNRGMWLSGDGIEEDAFNSNFATFENFLINDFGSDLTSGNYKAQDGSQSTTVGFLPTASWAHPGRVYGFDNTCVTVADVLALQTVVAGATEAAQYQNFAGPGPWTASIYRPVSPGVREYSTLLDGFDLSHVRANYASLAAVTNPLPNDVGRIAWFDDVAENHFNICVRRGSIVAVGDLPGTGGTQFANANLGSFPNPALAAHPVTLRFTLAQAQEVTVSIFTVAGREVASLKRRAAAGPNTVVWDGRLANGSRPVPGVYFYSIGAPGLTRSALAPGRMILVSSR